MVKFNRVLVIGLVLALILSACGGGDDKQSGGADSSTQPTATVKQEPASEQPTKAAPIEAPTVAPTEEAVSEPEDSGASVADLFDLGTLKTNPKELSGEALQSYRLRAEWKTEPKPGGTAQASLVGIEVAHTSDPLAEEITLMADDEGVGWHTIHIGNQMWMSAGDQWIEISSDEAATYDDMLFSLDSATAGLSGDAKLVGEETINGIETRHYTFDETILGSGLGLYSKIQGDVWVAVDGEYAVKYTFSAEDEEASYQWSWEVYDVNVPFTIEPPADAQGARDDIPILADATDRATYGAMTSYSSPTALQAAIDFYKEQMPAFDWTYDEAGSMLSEGFAMLNFSKAGETVTIMLSSDDSGGTEVVIQGGE